MHARTHTCCMACACNLLNRSESKALRAIQTALEAPDPDKGRTRPFLRILAVITAILATSPNQPSSRV